MLGVFFIPTTPVNIDLLKIIENNCTFRLQKRKVCISLQYRNKQKKVIMTRLERIEKKGYKVQFVMGKIKGQEGYCLARWGNTVVRGTSETNVYFQIFGY